MSKPKKQPMPEAGDANTEVAAPEPPAAEKMLRPKAPRLSDSLKAQADRVIAARDKKKAPLGADRNPREPEEDLVVFAFRLSAEERELIHKAAGPAKASRFVRTLVVAAAKRDEAVVRELLATVS